MFECKFKFELEDSLKSAKYIYKSQKRKQDKVIAILIPFLLAAMVAMLVYDIIKGKTIVWDIILIVSLVVLEVMYLIIPLTLVAQQKKAFKKQQIDQMDYVLVKIDAHTCVETFYKGGEEKGKSEHGLKFLTSYFEDQTRLVLVFNKVEYVCLKKAEIKGGIDKLKAHLEKAMSKSAKGIK